MSPTQEQAVKTRGYQLWQESGASHGHDREDWNRAEQEVEAAEDAAQSTSMASADRQRQSSVGTLPYTPAALFFTLAQGWVEFGSIFAGTTPWVAWGIRAR